MRRTGPALVLLLVWALCALAEEPVTFSDSQLKQAVEEELWVTDPTPADMQALTSLTARTKGISSLVGLGYAVNLRSLDVRDNQISDLSPLSGLGSLETLDASMNRLSSLSSLPSLASLTSLDVHDNPRLTDIAAVASLSKLRTLIARFDSISSVAPLSGLVELSYVDLCQNQITDISSLVGLTNLTFLDLRSNVLAQRACDVDIPQIIEDNPGIAISYHRCGPRQILIASTGGGRVTSPGEGEFWYDRGESILLTAQADPCYVFVGWSGALTSTLNPARYTVTSDQRIRANFESVLTELYVDNDAPRDPNAEDARVGDPEENGTPDHPFDTIQEALDVARNVTTIFVDRGTYRERISLLGKELYLVATDPCNPQAGPCVTIEGVGAGPVVQISDGRSRPCGLTGFVITQGNDGTACGIYCTYSKPRLVNCLIVGNRCSSEDGAVLYFYESRVALTNCTVADNYGGPDGAGITLVSGDIVALNSIFWNNRPEEIRLIDERESSIQYCDVRGWWPDIGNIAKDPQFARPGRWVDPQHLDIPLNPGDPRAVWVGGDYHLKSQAGRWDSTADQWVCDSVTSPCIDGGLPTHPVGPEPAPNGEIVNMGADGGTAETSKSL